MCLTMVNTKENLSLLTKAYCVHDCQFLESQYKKLSTKLCQPFET